MKGPSAATPWILARFALISLSALYRKLGATTTTHSLVRAAEGPIITHQRALGLWRGCRELASLVQRVCDFFELAWPSCAP